ncbi:chemotaxis protein CheY (plasmid) [Coraliomargarita sp. W4R53]
MNVVTPPGDVHLRWSRVPPGAVRREVAWSLIRSIVGDSILISNPCPHCGGPHGPVHLDASGIRASVSYAGETALVAVVFGDYDGFAIDAEPLHSPTRDAASLEGVLGSRTDVTVRDWIRVEAALKADRRGLRVDPATVVVSTDSAASWSALLPDSPPIAGWDITGPEDIAVSAAIVFTAVEQAV